VIIIKKGERMSIEQKLKISNSLKGRKFSNERKKHISESLKGRVLSKSHKENISKSLKGDKRLATNKGKFGVEHSAWKGDDVGYGGVHMWLYKNKKRVGICKSCGIVCKKSEFHNISGEHRRDVNDYIELCNSCHKLTRRGEHRGA
jgi:hypothetical protein